MAMSEAEIEAFLSETRVAVISTVDGDGRARSAPIWFEWSDGAPYLFTGRRSLKWRNLQHRPHATLCVDDRDPPYAAAVVEGPVEEVTDRSLYDLVLGMALRYYGEAEGRAFAESYRDNPGVVAFRIVPDRITAWNA